MAAIKQAGTSYNIFGTSIPTFSADHAQITVGGAGATKSFGAVPDGSGISGSLLQSGANTAATLTVNNAAGLKTGRTEIDIYLDDFVDSVSGLPITTTDFHSVLAKITFDNDGSNALPMHEKTVALTRGWNHIVLSRGIETLVTQNVAATIKPVNGTSSEWVTEGGRTAAWTSSMFDASMVAPQLSVTIPGVGGNIRTRTYFTGFRDGIRSTSLPHLIFDDGDVSVYNNAFQYMKDRGIRGSVAIIWGRLNTGGYLTTAMVQEMRDAGWDILSHSVNHEFGATMAGYTVNQCLAEITPCIDGLKSIGCNVRNSAYIWVAPYGGDQLMGSVNYRTALNQAGVWASYGTANGSIGAQLRGRRHIPRINFNTQNNVTGWTIADLLNFVRSNILAGCSPAIMLHKILNSGATTDVDLLTSEFKQLIDMLYVLQKARLCTVSVPTEALPELLVG